MVPDRLRKIARLGARASSGSSLTILLLTMGLNVYLYVIIPKGFFPQQDTGA